MQQALSVFKKNKYIQVSDLVMLADDIGMSDKEIIRLLKHMVFTANFRLTASILTALGKLHILPELIRVMRVENIYSPETPIACFKESIHTNQFAISIQLANDYRVVLDNYMYDIGPALV